jgi:predicted PolB exonuclease-like 3'-5' exonuclease
MSLMFLDIATIPDFELGARLYNLHDLSEKDVSRVMATKNREKGDDTGALPLHMQRILAISVLFQNKENIKIWSLGDVVSNEADLLNIAGKYVSEHKPDVITWSGEKTIFPVLNFRYMSHNLQLPAFTKKTDLMSELAGGSVEAGKLAATLHEVAVLAGYPGNKAMSDEEVWKHYLQGNIEPVRNNLELNLINTWFIYKRWQQVNGKIDPSAFEAEKQQLINMLGQEDGTHLTSFADTLT